VHEDTVHAVTVCRVRTVGVCSTYGVRVCSTYSRCKNSVNCVNIDMISADRYGYRSGKNIYVCKITYIHTSIE
jgi:hypothetical protein